MNAREMREKMGELHAQAGMLLNQAQQENRGLTTDEQAKFDGLMAEESSLRALVEREELHGGAGSELSQSRGRKTRDGIADLGDVQARREADNLLRAWALGPRASSSQRAAAERAGIDVDNPELELRALTTLTNTAGGFAVGDEAIRGFDLAEKYFGPVRRLARVEQTATGATLPVPTFDDTANTGEIVTEGSGITTTADPLFGQVVLHPFQYVSKAVIVSNQVLQDSAVPLGDVLGSELGKRIGRKQNLDLTVGAGTTVPFGLVTQASLGKTAAATNLITWDEIYDLLASVNVAYSSRPSAGFMMNSQTANFLRKLKDSQNRYLWEMSIQGASPGQPDGDGVMGRIAGFPVYANDDMSGVLATGNRVVVFGDFKSYWVQDAGPAILRRAEELRLLTNETVFVAFRRTDGNLANVNAVKYLRLA
jgi:HK97 family phage major capsid protein